MGFAPKTPNNKKKVVFQPSGRNLWQQFDDNELRHLLSRRTGFKVEQADRKVLISLLEEFAKR